MKSTIATQLLLLLLFSGLFGQNTIRLRPELALVLSANRDSTVAWYCKFFDFTVHTQYEVPQSGFRFALLQKGDFYLEITENAKSIKKKAYVPQDLQGNPMQGINKLCFATDNIEALYQRLLSAGYPIKNQLASAAGSLLWKGKIFAVQDPDGNLIQVVEIRTKN